VAGFTTVNRVVLGRAVPALHLRGAPQSL